ncbi:hypothetical protein [Dysgonomonas macrotermitis]|uniref:Uncharacterized protein n=1 Tax=Dysgonomonas macrotermitis TaxID=1346286 RepID=A0A1M4ZD38_9BACT|nr:hypothetical protein [Dysgonomonas macrotermitis]SHF15931.1 hypothetical protein SAMN05444362_10453 [Dysgonomonas macrotermitis]
MILLSNWKYLLTRLPACSSFCLDAKRSKKSRLRLQARPVMCARKLRQIKNVQYNIYLPFNAFFSQRVPRALRRCRSLTDENERQIDEGSKRQCVFAFFWGLGKKMGK